MGTSILIPLLLLNFNMRFHGNPTAWYLFLATSFMNILGSWPALLQLCSLFCGIKYSTAVAVLLRTGIDIIVLLL